MGRVYLHYVEWENTKDNHAGMAYLCNKLKEENSNVKLIKFSRLKGKGAKWFNYFISLFHILYLVAVLKPSDQIFFMEYLTRYSAYQENIAYIIRKFFPRIKIFGLVHLSYKHLIEIYKSDEVLVKHLNKLDDVIVFGGSLGKCLDNFENKKYRVNKVFHYVDTLFYQPKKNASKKKGLEIICLGNLKRNFTQLEEIIKLSPDHNFIICQGVLNLESKFSKYPNVELYNYLTEDKLKNLMQQSDISLNVMEDTVGSNVITTSMACGLAMIVSDVGSIREYCDLKNAFFCRSTKEFVKALDSLKDPKVLEDMKRHSFVKAQEFSIQNFKKWFDKLVNSCSLN